MSQKIRQFRQTSIILHQQASQNNILSKEHCNEDRGSLKDTYTRLYTRDKRAYSLYEDRTKLILNVNPVGKNVEDLEESHIQLINKKVLLCYPDDFIKKASSIGFTPFKQLKLQNLERMPRHIIANDSKKKIEMNSYNYINDQSETDMDNKHEVINELYHNKRMKHIYETTMFKQSDFHKQELEVKQRNRSKNLQQIIQSNVCDNNKKKHSSANPRRTFKEQLKQSEANQYINKIASHNQQRQVVNGFVRKMKCEIQPYTMPECREGAQALKISDTKAILIGGYSHKEHKYTQKFDLNSLTWDKIEQSQFIYPKAVGCSFSSLFFNDIIYLIGGERRAIGSGIPSNQLWMFKNQQWEQINYSGDYLQPRKDFASVLAGNGRYIVIIGGVGAQLDFFNDIHAIDLTMNKNTALNQNNDDLYNQKKTFQNGIAYHCAFTIPADQGGPDIQLYPDYKKKYQPAEQKQYGIYVFGGKSSKNQTYSKLYAAKSNVFPLTFEEVPTKGKQPVGRQSFTMNYSPKAEMMVVFGGTNDERIFNDLFLLFLLTMQWAQVKVGGDFLKPRYGHCSVFDQTSLIIFGGVCTEGFLTYEPYVIELNQESIKQLMNPIIQMNPFPF